MFEGFSQATLFAQPTLQLHACTVQKQALKHGGALHQLHRGNKRLRALCTQQGIDPTDAASASGSGGAGGGSDSDSDDERPAKRVRFDDELQEFVVIWDDGASRMKRRAVQRVACGLCC